jgi:hypothetical protein
VNNKQRLVIKSVYKDNCYVLVSAHKAKEQHFPDDVNIEYVVSFLYDAGNVACEWEPKYGPLQIWMKCSAEDDGAKEHYFYDYENAPNMSWSQLAVNNNGMKEAFLAGNYEHIFEVLKDWAESRNKYTSEE